MLGIGWVMFWKAFVLSAWIGIHARWQAYRRKRRETGLPMRYSARKKAYVVSDWTAWVDRFARFARDAFFALLFAWWAVIAYFLLTGQRDYLAGIMRSFLS